MKNQTLSSTRGDAIGGLLFFLGTLVLVAFCLFGLWGCPKYSVYQQGMEGQSELAKADYSKRVAVQEAQAKMDSAHLLAQAEVERAKGVAQANEIIGNSLKGNESYLRYLWIQSLESNNAKVIYVPTEANLPILEASRLPPSK